LWLDTDPNGYWNSRPGGVLDARTSTVVSDSGGTESIEGLNYDNPTTTANVTQDLHWRSRDSSGNPIAAPAPPYPGSLSVANSAVILHSYDIGGALLTTTDAEGFETVYALNQWCPFTASDGNTHYSNPTTITVANGTALQRSNTESWDCTTGLLTRSIDPNNVATGKAYDSIGRLLQTDEASGKPSERETNSTYTEASSSAASLTPLVVPLQIEQKTMDCRNVLDQIWPR
jgi:hypothetical protein